MNRYNSFNQIHKALRALLYDTAALVQQADYVNKEETSGLLERIEEVVGLFEGHAHTEDSMVLPALVEFEPSVVNVFNEEHEQDHKLAERLKELVFIFRHSETVETRIQTGHEINLAFVEFLVFNLNHMAKEEKVLNKLLWRYYTDEQLLQLHQQIVARQSPEKMAIASRWMMRGLNNREIIGWLIEVKKNAPPVVTNGLIATAESELNPVRWKTVQQNISEEKAVA